MLELGVLLAQLSELTQFAQSQSRILLLPDVVRRLADPMLAADVRHPGAALRLSQCPQDLFLRMSLLRHLRVLLVLARGPRLPLLTQLARGSLFGFWVIISPFLGGIVCSRLSAANSLDVSAPRLESL